MMTQLLLAMAMAEDSCYNIYIQDSKSKVKKYSHRGFGHQIRTCFTIVSTISTFNPGLIAIYHTTCTAVKPHLIDYFTARYYAHTSS